MCGIVVTVMIFSNDFSILYHKEPVIGTGIHVLKASMEK